MDSDQQKGTRHLGLPVCFEVFCVTASYVHEIIPSLEEGSFVIETEPTGKNLIDGVL